ncbi:MULTISPECIES: aspartate aminotransferase family protein [Pseudomonas]|jgi:glutamate-1-semialdehyde 2,1-aminomutase|uniref:Beta-phenylalanine transaminase n=1 Tax=Pseudomonas fluorescens TaxID=294 RepID=A0A5E7V1B8_PSEFL|nr:MULTISPECIES: aminotransferase class III-fold pyridoxal phosphate-dependent enzyme [Pseudomonas]QCY13093.1 aminotransferase class III-fold pyridoxal phosphate-dependent enzyme [Pseudomonas sp. MPC6]VVQ17697.1 Beta-phenylalanine transaminase [Pseudomonas fluorescens]
MSAIEACNHVLQPELDACIERFIRANPGSARQFDLAARVMPGGNTRSVLFYPPFPLTMSGGHGCFLTDLDGHCYIDFVAEYTAALYGHSNSVITQALSQAMANGMNLSAHTLLEARLATLIVDRFSCVEQVRFTNSGTEANLLALAAATAFTGRTGIIAFSGGYHGGALNFVGPSTAMNVPHRVYLADYNDLQSVERLLDEHRDEIAAILVEPMLGAGGCLCAAPGFLEGLRELALTHDALLIFDEVMTSRLAPGGLQQKLRVTPDLITLGKYLGGGLPCGMLGGRHSIMMQFDPRRQVLSHAGTFNNNVLTLAAGIAGLEQLYVEETALALNARGDALRATLNAVLAQAKAPLQFTGQGSVMNLHPTAKNIRHPADIPQDRNHVRDLFFFHLIENGIYIARRGLIALSLPLGEREFSALVGAVQSFIERYGARLPAD